MTLKRYNIGSHGNEVETPDGKYVRAADLAGRVGDFNPTIYFISAFDDNYMETRRVLRLEGGKTVPRSTVVRHGPPEDKKYRIERQRDDGVMLYYQDTGRFGYWTKNPEWATVDGLAKMVEVHRYVEKLAGKRGYYYPSLGSRTFGFYFKKEQAIAAVERNQSDMHERMYTWIVIEPYHTWGIHPISAALDTEGDVDESLWFKWEVTDSSKENYSGRWVRAERPEETKHTVCFAVG
jgi:hypothetical protein